ncbi:bestrophin family protein [Halomonas sp. V046]|uniref:bestrophin family protein n=1 Tax=Halomonas sp. V046 TaxID=3459611 RepID=UPI004044F6C3
MIVNSQTPTTAVLLFSLKGSIIPAIWKKVVFTVLISSIITMTHGSLFDFQMVLTATPFTLWGLTLAIFLTFRNTAAYQRFWEARTLWGELAIVSRTLARQGRSLLPDNEPQRRELNDAITAFAYLLKDHLRDQAPGEDARRVLYGGPFASVLDAQSPPNALLGHLGRRLMDRASDQGASDMVRVEMDRQLTRMTYVLGGCERIKTTPIPYPYILMLHRVVHIYCFMLPFCLIENIGWFTPFAVCVLAYTFFGLDALGDQIADPFDTQPNDLALGAICRNIERAVSELNDLDAPPALVPAQGVLL